MILDSLKNSENYAKINERLAKGLEALKKADFSTMEDGRYDIDGDNLFLKISTYDTKSAEETKVEAHRNYIDIQYIISGKENVLYAPLETMQECIEEHPESDLYFYKGETQSILLDEGMYMIFFPSDAHGPSVSCCGKPQTVRKALVKVRI